MSQTIQRFYNEIFERLTNEEFLVNLDITPSIISPSNPTLLKYEVEFSNELERLPKENLTIYAQSAILLIDENHLFQNMDINRVIHRQSLFDPCNSTVGENIIQQIEKYSNNIEDNESIEENYRLDNYYHFILHVSGRTVDITNLLLACNVFVYLISEVFYKNGIDFIQVIKKIPRLRNDWAFLFGLAHNLDINKIKLQVGNFNFKGDKTKANLNELAALYILKWIFHRGGSYSEHDNTNIARLTSFILFREMRKDIRESVSYKFLSSTNYRKETRLSALNKAIEMLKEFKMVDGIEYLNNEINKISTKK